jgi:hypothetical protein
MKAGVAVHDMSAEEKQVVESLSPEEVDTLLKAKGKYDNLIKGKEASTSLKIL